MNASTDVIPRSEETDAELELSAQDLLALSAVRQVEEPAIRPVPPPARPAKSAPTRKLKLSLTFSLMAAVGVIGAIYVLSNSERASQPNAGPSQQLAQTEWAAPAQLAEGEPVRFANPFDANEVFEFPAGTSESQARDAVAEVLLKRAASRQRT
jgi:hypothetical protein